MSVFTNLDQPLFDGADATKGDLIAHLDANAERLLAELRDRPLSVIRVHRGSEAFMQKHLPRHAPESIRSIELWAEASHRMVRYALCDDRDALLWFGNQRAVEYHVPLVRASDLDHPTHLVLDLDPPEGDGFPAAVAAARLVRTVLDDLGLPHAVKTSGAKGLHVAVALVGTSVADAAAATHAIAGRAAALDPDAATTAFLKDERGGRTFIDATRVGTATVVAAWSPRARPGVPVSFPVRWEALDDLRPAEITIRTLPARIGEAGPWLADLEPVASLPADLLDEGRALLRAGSGRRGRRGRPKDR